METGRRVLIFKVSRMAWMIGLKKVMIGDDDWIKAMMSELSLRVWESERNVKNALTTEHQVKQPDERLQN